MVLHQTFCITILIGMDNKDLKERSYGRLNNRRLAELTGQREDTISHKLRGRPGYPLGACEALAVSVAETVSDEDWAAIETRFSEIADEFNKS